MRVVTIPLNRLLNGKTLQQVAYYNISPVRLIVWNWLRVGFLQYVLDVMPIQENFKKFKCAGFIFVKYVYMIADSIIEQNILLECLLI